jgi:hypothetical protein
MGIRIPRHETGIVRRLIAWTRFAQQKGRPRSRERDRDGDANQ